MVDRERDAADGASGKADAARARRVDCKGQAEIPGRCMWEGPSLRRRRRQRWGLVWRSGCVTDVCDVSGIDVIALPRPTPAAAAAVAVAVAVAAAIAPEFFRCWCSCALRRRKVLCSFVEGPRVAEVRRFSEPPCLFGTLATAARNVVAKWCVGIYIYIHLVFFFFSEYIYCVCDFTVDTILRCK